MGQQHRKTLKHFNDPGHAHVLTFSCYRRLPLLSKDRTRRWVLEALGNTRTRYNYAILAFVIMPEHVHVLIYPRDEDYDVADFLKSVKQSVSRKAKLFLAAQSSEWLRTLSVETPHGRVFRFWQAGSGYDRNIKSMKALKKEIEYICNNPVRRGLVANAVDWPWSSAASHIKGIEGLLQIDSLDDIFSEQR